MPTLEIHLPEPLQTFLAEQARAEGYHSPSEYVLALLRQLQGVKERADEEAKLLAGLDSLDRGEGRSMTTADWEKLRADIRARYGEGE